MPRKAVRYNDPQKLRAAVLEECRVRWRALTGADWSPGHAEYFKDPDVPAETQEVSEIAAGLMVALRRALDFRTRPDESISAPAARLRHFVDECLAPLVAMPEALRSLEQLVAMSAPGWEFGKSGLVCSVLTGKNGRWRRQVGLNGPVTRPTTWAIVALLIGEYPELAVTALLRNRPADGATVGEVIGKQAEACSARKRHMDALEQQQRPASEAPDF